MGLQPIQGYINEVLSKTKHHRKTQPKLGNQLGARKKIIYPTEKGVREQGETINNHPVNTSIEVPSQ